MKLGENRPYHHGDLRHALLDAALQLVEERGVHGFTLREVARHAGVSHNAPYHHFADKAELVASLTIEGFQTLEQAMRSTYEQATGTPLERTLAISGTYIRFALENQAVFRLMFRPELHQSSHNAQECNKAVKDAMDAVIQILLDGIYASQQAGLLKTEIPVEILTLTLCSTIHGMTVMHLDNLLIKKTTSPSLEEVEQLMKQVMLVVAQGIAVPL